MSVLDVLSAARDLGRLQDIVGVLLRHGLGDLVGTLGLAGPLDRAGKVLRVEAIRGVGQLSTPERVRRAFEELGPTFVKFGQLLASRADLVPDEWVTELSRLREHVEPVAWEKLLPQLEEDLGGDPLTVLPGLSKEPLAAGSIAQVHPATLADGTEVVLKVRRPGIREKVEADLRLLSRLAEVVASELPDLRRYRPRKLVRAFARTLREELDLDNEARNTEQLARQLEGMDGITLPRVIDEFGGERLLVLERFHGTSIGRWLTTGEPTHLDGPHVARVGADALLSMVFVHGFFHADPHPGNLMLLDDGRVGLLDCGMVGRLSEGRRQEFVALLGGALRRDERSVVDTLLGWTEDEDEVDLDQLGGDVRAVVDRYHGASLDHVRMDEVLSDVLEIVRDNNLFLPSDVASLLRVLLLLDGVGRELDPEFDLTAHLQPFAERLVRKRMSWRRALVSQAKDVGELVAAAPRDLREILSKARRGRFKLDVDVKRLDDFAVRIDRSASRVTMGLVTSALIVGTSIALTVDQGPKLLGMPAFALLGFLSSVGFGLLVLVSIWRGGRT